MTSWTKLVLGQYRDSDRVALTDQHNRWTGRELVRRSAGAAAWLADLGLEEGTAVPALVTNAAASVALLIGGAATGRPLSPLGPRSTAREILACEQAMTAPVLLAEREFTQLALDVAAISGARIAWIDDVPQSSAELPIERAPDDVAYVLHTSGTTGRPKRVQVRQLAMANRTACNSELLQLDTDSVFASASGFHHIGGVGNLAVALGSGSTIACFPKFTVEAWQELPKFGVSHVQTVSSMIEMLLSADAIQIPGLRVLLHGGSPIRPETLRKLVHALPDTDFVDLFGQTEGSPITCLSPEDHRLAVAGAEHLLESVGRPVDRVEFKIADVNEDGVGEILARGDHLFLLSEDGWQHTGDLARQDAEGYVYLVGRQGDKIIRGGENIYPIEVENVLILHPSVVDVAVVGAPDERLGEIVRAFIVPLDLEATPDPEELRVFVRQHLAGFKVPAVWDFIAELPRNPNGKVLRRRLADI